MLLRPQISYEDDFVGNFCLVTNGNVKMLPMLKLSEYFLQLLLPNNNTENDDIDLFFKLGLGLLPLSWNPQKAALLIFFSQSESSPKTGTSMWRQS